MNSKTLVRCVLAALLSQGCATITSTEMQSLSLTTQAADGGSLERASCTLRNDKGSWSAESPGLVPVHRSGEDLVVECKKDGHPDGVLRAISRAAVGMFGNIIFGGLIGAAIDHNKGTGYDYPDWLPVRMGATVIVDRWAKPDALQAGGASAAGLNSASSAGGGPAQSGERVGR